MYALKSFPLPTFFAISRHLMNETERHSPKKQILLHGLDCCCVCTPEQEDVMLIECGFIRDGPNALTPFFISAFHMFEWKGKSTELFTCCCSVLSWNKVVVLFVLWLTRCGSGILHCFLRTFVSWFKRLKACMYVCIYFFYLVHQNPWLPNSNMSYVSISTNLPLQHVFRIIYLIA